MPSMPPAAKPARRIFDPWNSSSTGHQYAENRMSGSTSWRESRSAKLASQFGDQFRTGGERMYDAVGAGALGFGRDRRTENGGWDEGSVRGPRRKTGMRGQNAGAMGDLGAWLRGDKDGLRGGVVRDLKRERDEQEAVIRERAGKKKKVDQPPRDLDVENKTLCGGPVSPQQHWTKSDLASRDLPEELQRPSTARSAASLRKVYNCVESHERPVQDEDDHEPVDPLSDDKPTTIFQNCVFYINGSTMPLISDHRLKYLISQHGGLTAIALGRRTVTHVIVGTPNSKGGVGGGLSGSKVQKEIEKIRGKGIKFVGANWLLESVKAGKRLTEAAFAVSSVSVAPVGVKSVYGLFKQTSSKSTVKGPSQKRG